jgi:ABC-type transport system involved in cytochrome c biogenesis permease subunit
MSSLSNPLLLLIPGIGYLLAAVLVLLRQFGRGEALTRASGAAVWVGLITHLGLMILRLWHAPAASFTGVREFSVLLALLLVLAYLLTRKWLRGGGIAGAALGIAGLTLLVTAPILPLCPAPAPAILMNPWLLLHVPLVLLAYLMYALAGSGGVMYLIVSALLKARHPLALSGNMPTLESLERFAHRMAEVGFPLLTAGIMTGMVWSHEVWGVLIPETPKQMFALVAWGIYAAYFHARMARGVRGRFCAWLLVAGLVMVIVGLLTPPIARGPHNFI